jgi:hypothetical protein
VAHAYNARKFLLRPENRTNIKRRYVFAIGAQHSQFSHNITAKQLVKQLPLCRALRTRENTPPGQKFTRQELEYLYQAFGAADADNLSSGNAIDDAEFEDDIPTERAISAKAGLYLASDA